MCASRRPATSAQSGTVLRRLAIPDTYARGKTRRTRSGSMAFKRSAVRSRPAPPWDPALPAHPTCAPILEHRRRLEQRRRWAAASRPSPFWTPRPCRPNHRIPQGPDDPLALHFFSGLSATWFGLRPPTPCHGGMCLVQSADRPPSQDGPRGSQSRGRSQPRDVPDMPPETPLPSRQGLRPRSLISDRLN